MEVSQAERPGTSRSDDLEVYARRRARMTFLLQSVGWDREHPVVVAESRLVEMAGSKLRESLLVRHGETGLVEARTTVEESIREAMRGSVPSFVSSLDGRASLRAAVDREQLEDVFLNRGA